MSRSLRVYVAKQVVSKLIQFANHFTQFANHLCNNANQFIQGAVPISSKGSADLIKGQCQCSQRAVPKALKRTGDSLAHGV